MHHRFSWLVEVVVTLRPEIRNTLPEQFPEAPIEAWALVERAAMVSEDELVQAVAAHFTKDVADLSRSSPSTLAYWPFASALRHNLIPLSIETGRLRVATSNPTNEEALEMLRFASGMELQVEIQAPAKVENTVLRLYGDAAQQAARDVIDLDASPEIERGLDPVVRLARRLLRIADTRGASDLHLQPYMGGYLVRLRVDGVLARLSTLSHDVGTQVIRHFKATSGMNSTDPFKPQDGRGTAYVDNRRLDLRLSSVPNAQGERLVVRVLNQSRVFSLERLGYAPARAQTLQRLTRLDSGLVLFVGPTGSGKTTSLYALISTINSMQRSIATIEQPVEYVLPGLSQVEVRPERGASFQNVLRAQLRQDPDVLLIGEIRDEETAAAAVRAAMTGHLVFSTLHASTARYAVPRLLDLGVSSPMLGDALRAVVSQRLVRKICSKCATPVVEPLSASERLFSEITSEQPKMRAVGCDECDYQGYRGVMPVLEFYIPSSKERMDMMASRVDPAAWDGNAVADESLGPDERPMALRVLDLIVSGMTTIDAGLSTMGEGYWLTLAKHFKGIGWFEGTTDAAALHTRSANETTILVCGSDTTFVSELELELKDEFKLIPFSLDDDAREVLRGNPNTGLLLMNLVGDDPKAIDMLKSLRQSLAWTGLSTLVMVPPDAPSLKSALETRLANRVIHKPVSTRQVADYIHSLSWGDK